MIEEFKHFAKKISLHLVILPFFNNINIIIVKINR